MNTPFLLLIVVGIAGAIRLPQGLQTTYKLSSFLEAAIPDNRNCDHERLGASQKQFNKELNLTDGADWTNAAVFIGDVQKILRSGVDGLLRLCASRTRFYQGLGVTYDDCISYLHFREHGYSEYNSREYVKIFKELEFMCNGGLLQAVQKWDCLMSLDAQVVNDLLACEEKYKQTAGDDYTTMCPAAEDLLSCVRTPFFQACGKDSGWFECEIYRINLDMDQYCPHLMCSYESSSVASIRSVSRHHLFRSQNPFFMPPEKQMLFSSLGKKADERMKRRKRQAGY